MDGRQQRGLQLVASGKVVKGAALWHVASQTNVGGRGYRVNPWADSCTCPDHQELNIRCKHIWAVLITMETETPEGPVTQTARITYSQEWSSYNRAQVEEKDTFLRLLADLCRDDSAARAGARPSTSPAVGHGLRGRLQDLQPLLLAPFLLRSARGVRAWPDPASATFQQRD